MIDPKKDDKGKWEQWDELEKENMSSEGGPSEIQTEPEELEFTSREALEKALAEVERQRDEYKNQSLRALADMENLRKRTERDLSNAIKFGSERLVLDLLPVLDSLIRGLESPESQDPHAKGMREGLSLTLDLFHKTLQKQGVEVIDPQSGDNFDPHVHEALSSRSDPSFKPNSVIQVIQKGYQLNGRVLRAARVIVAV